MKYAATYRLPNRKAVVHVVAPPPMTAEQKEAVLYQFHQAGWEIWNSLSVEERLRINAECDKAE